MVFSFEIKGQLSLRNAWLPLIFVLDSNSPSLLRSAFFTVINRAKILLY